MGKNTTKGRVKIIRRMGAEPRVENPFKYEVVLAGYVVRALCQFWHTQEEREALINALEAFGEVTGVQIGGFTDKRQGIYLASAKANEMKRAGDVRGVEARAHVRLILEHLWSGNIRYGRVTLEELRPSHGRHDKACDLGHSEEWPEYIGDDEHNGDTDNFASLETERRIVDAKNRFDAMPENKLFALKLTTGFQGWGINYLDAAILVKTADVVDGDFAFVRTPDGGHLLGRVFFDGEHLRITWPHPVPEQVYVLRDVTFVARVIRVCACEGQHVGEERALPFKLRGFDGGFDADEIQDYGEAA